MPLSAVYRSRSVYHFTPIANLPAILEHGLLAISEQKRLGLPLHTIVWEAIQAHRASLAVRLERADTWKIMSRFISASCRRCY